MPFRADTRNNTPPPAGDGRVLDDVSVRLGVEQRQPSSPLDVGRERRRKFGIGGQFGVVGSPTHGGGEPDAAESE